MTATGWPALNPSEILARHADEKAGRHWAGWRCWCGTEHDTGTQGLVRPPWVQGETGEGS